MIRYHEEQRFHGAIFGVLLASLLLVAVATALAAFTPRQPELWTIAIGPVVVIGVTILISLSHLDVDVDDSGVRIAFRYLWPARHIAFADISELTVRRYRALFEYGGWGVRLGPAGWAFNTGGDVGVQLRLRKGLPVLIGSRTPHDLEAAIRARMG